MKSNSVILMHFRNYFMLFIVFFAPPAHGVIKRFVQYRYKIAPANAQEDVQFSDLMLWHDRHIDSDFPQTVDAQKKQIRMMLGYLRMKAIQGTAVNVFIETKQNNNIPVLFNKNSSCVNEVILHAIEEDQLPNFKFVFYDKRTPKEGYYVCNPLKTPPTVLRENYTKAHEATENADLSRALKVRLKQRIDATFGRRAALASRATPLRMRSEQSIVDIINLHTDTSLTCDVLKSIQQPSITLVYGGSAHMFAVDDIVRGQADMIVQEDGIKTRQENYKAIRSATPWPTQFAVQAMRAFIQHREQQRLLANQRAEMHAWMNEQQGPSWDADAWLEHVWKEKQKTKPLETKRVNI